MHTIVEVPSYLKAAEKLLTEREQDAIVEALAANPQAGDVIPGTSGCRKLRFGKQGLGKRGGVRLIYLYGGPNFPVFLLTVYAKNEKGNLSKSEQNALGKAASRIFDLYGGNR